MLPIFNITDEMTSSATSMDISESFRPEDLSKTDFFDFVSAPEQEGNQAAQNSNIVGTNSTNDQPLQGFDQFWGAEKETQQRLESAIFEDLNRYCWNQQNNAANISISSATANSSSNAGPQVINNGDGQIYTITVLNSSSADQWLRKDISTSSGGVGGGGGDQPNGLDINLDTILSNYPYVKTECFSYDDSGFGTAESTKEELNYQHPSPQLLQPQSTGVTTTSVLLESNLNANSDLISYTDMSNNNNEWNIDRNEIKDWETCEANESPESLLRSALQGKGYAKTVHLQNGITVIPAQNSVKDEELRRALFTNDQETLTFADSTLSNSLFDDSQNPQSTLSQHASGVVDDMFLTLDNAFTDEFEKMKRIASEVQQFCTIDSQGNGYGEVITIENNAINATQNSILNSNDLTNNNSLIINNNSHTGKINKSRSNGIKTTKKYKKSINNNNTNIMNNNNNNNDTSTINNNLHNNNKVSAMSNLTTASSNGSSASVMPSNANGLSPGSGTSCNGIRKERSLHYCSICSKGFKDKYSVNVHIRTHTGEKPFSCSLCGKSFRQKAHLAKHYQTHLQKSTNGSVKSKHHQKHSMAAVQSQPIAQTPSLNVINV